MLLEVSFLLFENFAQSKVLDKNRALITLEIFGLRYFLGCK
jgi:uncharacterized Fe-S cluster-containing protein